MPREIPNETRFPSRNPTNWQGFVKRDCRVNSVVSETRAFRENYLSFQVDETLFPAIETLFPPIKFFLSFHLCVDVMDIIGMDEQLAVQMGKGQPDVY